MTNWRHRAFDPACRTAGIVGLTPHDLRRHTAASFAAGANVKAVQGMLGHASAAMTLDIYAVLFPDDLDNVGAVLGGVALDVALCATRAPKPMTEATLMVPLSL